MFLPLSFFLVKIILSIFQILMVGAVTAGLALYARFGGEYANSIRWIRQGGYLEMGGALYNSGRTVPIQAKLAMVVAIIVSLAATQLDTAISFYIYPAERGNLDNYVVITSNQSIPADAGTVFSNWSISIQPLDDIVDAMYNKIDTLPLEKSLYLRTTKYSIECEYPGITLMGNQSDNAVLTNGDCYKILVYNTPGRPNYQNNSVQQYSPWSMISPALPGDSGNNTRYLEPLRVSLLRGTDNCLVGEVNDLNEDPLMNSGVVSLPMTITIKCISPDMHISVLSITTVRFISFSDHLQRTANSIFMEEEELFQAIERSINQVTPENTPIFTEVRAHKSSIEIATCEHRGVKPMLCLYTNINGYVLKPEKVDPVLAKARKTSSFKSNPNNYAAVSIGHLPSNDYGEWVFPSISKLKDDTLRVSRFMAELGQNFYTDYESMELYTLYNTEEKGVEISDWLVYSMIVSMIVCFCFWVTISILLRNTPYSDSLYTSISRQLESKTKMTGPSIMRSTVDPATIEGIPLIYNQDGPTI